MLLQDHQAVHGDTGTGRTQADAAAFGRAHAPRPACPWDLKRLLPRMRAVGITTAVAKISGEGRESRVDSVTVYPSPEIRIRVPVDRVGPARVPEGAVARKGETQIMAADAIKAVVEEMIHGIWWARGHRGELWIEVSNGTTRLEMHSDRD